jgi:hypothetical protein
MPYFLISGRSSHDYLREPKFHLLVFANKADSYEAIRQAFESEYEGFADLQFFALDERARGVFGTSEPFLLLLRPDNHVAFVSTEVSLARVQAYIEQFIGPTAF